MPQDSPSEAYRLLSRGEMLSANCLLLSQGSRMLICLPPLLSPWTSPFLLSCPGLPPAPAMGTVGTSESYADYTRLFRLCGPGHPDRPLPCLWTQACFSLVRSQTQLD